MEISPMRGSKRIEPLEIPVPVIVVLASIIILASPT